MFKKDTIEKRILRLVEQSGIESAHSVSAKLGIPAAVIVAHMNVLAEQGYLIKTNITPVNGVFTVGYRYDAWKKSQDEVEELRNKIADLENTLALANAALNAGSQLIEELSEGEECHAYMVSVDGEGAPQYIHPTIEAARQEAERIASLKRNATVRILAVVDVLRVQTREIRTSDWERQAENCNGQCEGRPNA